MPASTRFDSLDTTISDRLHLYFEHDWSWKEAAKALDLCRASPRFADYEALWTQWEAESQPSRLFGL